MTKLNCLNNNGFYRIDHYDQDRFVRCRFYGSLYQKSLHQIMFFNRTSEKMTAYLWVINQLS